MKLFSNTIKKTAFAVILTLVFTFGAAATGCSVFSKSDANDPVSAIQAAYGNAQYTVSFSVDTLSEPLDDIYYTAYSMPVLPTPERVGYIFEGWYLDSAYTVPYTDGILYLYMSDVTLYAKWSKEEFATNGTYDIEFSTEILEGSVEKGEWTDSLGGYADFGEAIVASETYIEKTDENLRLRLQYDCGTTVPYGAKDVYQVSISALMRGSVSIIETVSADTETVKTVYIDIDNLDIADTLYLSITWTNWEVPDLETAYRSYTTTTYTVAFNVTRLIGFTRPFVDTSKTLDDGFYLVQTHYWYKSGGASSMAEAYNPVYAYVIASGGRYTLVKPFSPYAGFIGTTGQASLTDYLRREMTYIPIQLCYSLGVTDFSVGVLSDYYPEAYDAGYYSDISVEFHADTGRFYSVYELGDTLDQSLMVVGSASGAMEAIGAAGILNIVMTVDTGHVVRLTDIDYEPLSGDSYGVGGTMKYYAGELSDLNERNMTLSETENYGLATTLYNFFYSGDRLYSSRITVSPTQSSTLKTVAQSRYSIAEFTVQAEIYGYDPASAALYADCYAVDAFEGLGIRQWNAVVQGKTLSAGESVSVQALYDEFVKSGYSVTAATVSYSAYALTSEGAVDTSRPVSLGSVFTYAQDTAIVFVTDYGEGESTTIVRLTGSSSPSVTVGNTENDTFKKSDDGYYYASSTYTVGEAIEIPAVAYSWGKTQYSFFGDWYGNGVDGIDPTRVVLYSVEDGAWSLTYLSRDSTSFVAISDTMYLVFELRNEYGERSYLYVGFTSKAVATYEVVSSLEGTLLSGNVTYDSNGLRRGTSATQSYFLTEASVGEYVNASYTVTLSTGNTRTYTLGSCTVYAQNATKSFAVTDSALLSAQVNAYLAQNGYAYVALFYTTSYYNGVRDEINVQLLYGMTVNGKTTSDVMSHRSYFTGYDYQFYVPALYTGSGTLLASSTVSIRAYSGDTLLEVSKSTSRYTLTNSGLQYTLNYNSTGDYRISYSVSLLRDENGDYVFKGRTTVITFTFYQYVTVVDGTGSVTVTYVSDAAHPFSENVVSSAYSDGMMSGYAYTTAYSLLSGIYLINKSTNFVTTTDQLFGWVTDTKFGILTASYVYDAGGLIADFIGEYHTNELTLYAVWDTGITVTAVVENADGTVSVVGTPVTKYLNASGYYQISVQSDLSVKPSAPSGYVFVGWTGGFLGTDVVSSGTYRIYASTALSASQDYFTVSAVFRAQIKVSFRISSEYAAVSTKAAITVTDGEKLTATQYTSAMNVIAKSGYSFVGWAYLDAEGNYVIIDLQEEAVGLSLINGDGVNLILYAVFSDGANLYYSS